MLLLVVVGLLLSLIGSVFIQFIIHEAGHLVFGLLCGYRFASFRIGNLMLIRQNGILRFKRLSLAGTGGQCLLIPPELKDGRLPVVHYLMGGALLNLVSAPFFLGFHVLTRGLPFLSFQFLLLACIGVIVALSNGIPMRTKLVDNDGYLVISLRKSEAARRCFWVQLKINELIANGMRLKAMPANWFVMPPEKDPRNTLCANIGVLICKWLAAFEKTARTYPHPCDIESEREIMAVVQKTGQEHI